MDTFYEGLVITRRKTFAGVVTGTPSVSLYKNGVIVGSPEGGTGSGATWLFSATVPAGDVGDSIQVEASGTVDGQVQVIVLAEGQMVELQALDAQLAAIAAQTALIGSPAAPISTPSASSIYAQVGSIAAKTLSCSESLSGKTLKVVFESRFSTTDIATVADGSITKSGLDATFALPSATTSVERTLNVRVINVDTGSSLCDALLFVTRGPSADA